MKMRIFDIFKRKVKPVEPLTDEEKAVVKLIQATKTNVIQWDGWELEGDGPYKATYNGKNLKLSYFTVYHYDPPLPLCQGRLVICDSKWKEIYNFAPSSKTTTELYGLVKESNPHAEEALKGLL